MQYRFGVLALGLNFFSHAVLGSPVAAAEITAAPAVPRPATDPSNVESIITSSGGTAIGGALYPTPATRLQATQTLSKPPAGLTISVVNQHGAAVSTTHARNSDAPAATSGNVADGTIPAGATAIFAVPTNWGGRVAVAAASDGPLTDARDVSLIEANFDYSADYGFAVADVDISYVDAFSLPIVCSCSGKAVSGCNKNLFSLHSCPSGNLHKNSCYNPLKADEGATAATTFFAPCSKAAYTFPNDNNANSFGDCQSGHITCCIGTSCPAGPNQA